MPLGGDSASPVKMVHMRMYEVHEMYVQTFVALSC